MTKVADKSALPPTQTTPHNLKDMKPFRGGTTKAGKPLDETLKPEITDQARNLKASEAKTENPPTEAKIPDSPSVLEKAGSVAKALAKAPVMPIVVPAKTQKLEEKISDKKPDPVHFIKKPAVIFVQGFSAFGISNGDGISDMADNYPGAKKFSWEEHDKIMTEIKKHAPGEPVVLVGHSFGGDTAIEIANELNSVKNGFRQIDLLVSIDAVGMNKSIIPINVKSNLNFFTEGVVPFLHGDPTVARNTKYTEVTNELRNELHTKMDDSPEVQFEIFNKINEVLGNHGEEDIFIEISETNQIKDVLEAIKNSL